MDVIPLDATLVKGSHGRIPESKTDWPVIICNEKLLKGKTELLSTDIFEAMMNAVL
jgi:hypothetical protein